MDFVNRTQVAAGWTFGFDRNGRELVIVAVKATFDIPQAGLEAQLAGEQAPLVAVDTFSGEPGLSAPVYEVDYAHRKPKCDVLLNASAYAPQGRLSPRVVVSVRVANMVKAFAVVGPRVWRKGIVGHRASDPQPFACVPIGYDTAFGGTDAGDGTPDVKTFLANPVGRGYRPYEHQIEGTSLPNSEEVGTPIESPTGTYRPMAFGSLGRSWQPRAGFAGTYDKEWVDHRLPFWPRDLDDRYFQAAPPDQHIAYPVGGELVTLKNLTPDGELSFRLPPLAMPVLFVPHEGRELHEKAVIDTIMIEPDLGRFSMTWRVSKAMRRSCFDLREVIVGELPEAWYRRRRLGNKPYYKSLADLVRDRAGRR